MVDAVAVGVVVRDVAGTDAVVAAFREILPSLVVADGPGDDTSVVFVPGDDAPDFPTLDDAALAYVARSLDGLVDRVVVFDHGVSAVGSDGRDRSRAFLDWLRLGDRPLVVRSSDVWPRYVVARLRNVVADEVEVFDGRVAVLNRLDSTSRSDYVASLATLLDHGGDVPAAAAAMFLHPNTLRYRVRRIKEITGLDLDDPVDRFVAELQIRLRFSPAL